VDSRLQVGGPATAELSWLPEFLAFTSAGGVPVDFVSTHLYPTDPTLPQTRDSFMEAVGAAAGVAAAAGLPLVLTEFNAGLGPPSLCHNYSLLDSSFAAAFALHQHLLAQAVPALASMSWWTFTDFGFEEQGADPHVWWPGHTKFGAMTRTGVPKPVYRGLQMIAEQVGAPGGSVPVTPQSPLAAQRLYLDAAGRVVGAGEGTVDVLASSSGQGQLTVLAGNFNSSFGDLPPTATVTLTLTGLARPAAAQATLELLDELHTNPMAVWESLGSPLYPSPSEVAAEMAAASLQAQPLPVTPGAGGNATLTLTLLPYAMARVVVVLG
jgi:xylan 1,4-beta-xylosidase